MYSTLEVSSQCTLVEGYAVERMVEFPVQHAALLVVSSSIQ